MWWPRGARTLHLPKLELRMEAVASWDLITVGCGWISGTCWDLLGPAGTRFVSVNSRWLSPSTWQPHPHGVPSILVLTLD